MNNHTGTHTRKKVNSGIIWLNFTCWGIWWLSTRSSNINPLHIFSILIWNFCNNYTFSFFCFSFLASFLLLLSLARHHTKNWRTQQKQIHSLNKEQSIYKQGKRIDNSGQDIIEIKYFIYFLSSIFLVAQITFRDIILFKIFFLDICISINCWIQNYIIFS